MSSHSVLEPWPSSLNKLAMLLAMLLELELEIEAIEECLWRGRPWRDDDEKSEPEPEPESESQSYPSYSLHSPHSSYDSLSASSVKGGAVVMGMSLQPT